MDNDLQNLLNAMSHDSDRLQAAILELTRLFPGVANRLAWQEAIFIEQRNHLTGPNDSHDYRLEIAANWIGLAQEGRLEPTMSANGLSVVVRDDETLKHSDLESVLFKKLNKLDDLKALTYSELYAAVDHWLGLSLSQHLCVLSEVLESLSSKNYLRYETRPGKLRITPGLKFDQWKSMNEKSQPPSVMNNSFTFNDQVGAVQTGTASVANVQQTNGAKSYADLKLALQALSQKLSTSDLLPSEHQEAEELIGKTIQEIESGKPSKHVVKALCSGLATTVQTLGSASSAYQAVVAALASLGISLG
ncbi:hypothetical protein [Pseudomonas oryzihabitans]|uniref:hypothetical protein n=1 Tax=Pseudomonas oryzihabitans TaxID=47885 RepID=UPI0012698C2D|nr:hypothetical protein [Pseudomonas oryzihabitans]